MQAAGVMRRLFAPFLLGLIIMVTVAFTTVIARL